ncbi:MAG: SCO1664 family protein [Microthrixaceae bacterium]
MADADPAEGREFTYEATIAPADTEAMLTLLREGEIEVLGLMPWSSNGTFLTQVVDGEDHAPAIYKPHRGERPLWDFPGGLWKREVASWELSDELGFGLVPPTVARVEGAPMGPGSLQAFVPARFDEHYFTLRDSGDPEIDRQLRELCVLDLVANATDRKGGHCLLDDEDRLWAIDNGLSFHTEFKLRTVLWDFAGDPIPDSAIEPLNRLVERGVPQRLTRWLEHDECDAVAARAAEVLAAGEFPHDPTGHRIPWPLV